MGSFHGFNCFACFPGREEWSWRALGSTIGNIPLGFWAAPLSVELDATPVLPFAGVGSSQNSCVVGVCDAACAEPEGREDGWSVRSAQTWLGGPGSICCWDGWGLCLWAQKCPVPAGYMNVTTVRSCLKEIHRPPKGQLCDHPLQAAVGSLPFCQGWKDFPASSISCPILLLTSMWIFMSSESHYCTIHFLVSLRCHFFFRLLLLK